MVELEVMRNSSILGTRPCRPPPPHHVLKWKNSAIFKMFGWLHDLREVGIYYYTFDFDTFKSVIFRYSQKYLLGYFDTFGQNFDFDTFKKTLLKITLLKVYE